MAAPRGIGFACRFTSGILQCRTAIAETRGVASTIPTLHRALLACFGFVHRRVGRPDSFLYQAAF